MLLVIFLNKNDNRSVCVGEGGIRKEEKKGGREWGDFWEKRKLTTEERRGGGGEGGGEGGGRFLRPPLACSTVGLRPWQILSRKEKRLKRPSNPELCFKMSPWFKLQSQNEIDA